MRPQSVVLVVVVAAMLLWGGGHVASGTREMDASLAANVSPTAPTATPLPTSTPPLTLAGSVPTTPTIATTPTMAPTVAPTAVPQPTARPAVLPVSDDQAAIVITQPQTGRQEVALTFDAGEGPGHTQEILDILDRNGVVATFGVTGEWATANPALLQEIVAAGHQVMNHSYTHGSFTGVSPGTAPMTPDQMRDEVVSTDTAIRANGNGYDPRGYFRFPYGDYDDQSLQVLKQAGYDYSVWWGCDSLAWMGNTAEQIVQACGHDKLAPGLIVLLHVTQDADLGALPGLIERYRAAGYDMVTVEQLVLP